MTAVADRTTSRGIRTPLAGRVAFVLSLLILGVIVVAPLLWMLSVSFMSAGTSSTLPTPILPSSCWAS